MSDWKLAYHANCWGALGGNAVGVTSITQLSLSHLRRHGPGASATSPRPVTKGVELFDGNLLDY